MVQRRRTYSLVDRVGDVQVDDIKVRDRLWKLAQQKDDDDDDKHHLHGDCADRLQVNGEKRPSIVCSQLSTRNCISTYA